MKHYAVKVIQLGGNQTVILLSLSVRSKALKQNVRPHLFTHTTKLPLPALCLLAGIFLLAACGPATPTPCGPSDLVAPQNSSPINDEIVLDYAPTFSWTYDSCEPDGWHAQVTTYGGYAYGTTQDGSPAAVQTSWVFATPLQPATQYEWHVAATSGGTEGPYSTSTRFWTGPICDTATLAAPLQDGPADHSTIDNVFGPLSWSYPGGCIPEQTLLELDTDPTFPGPNLVVGLGAPRIGQVPIDDLTDCTQYYWRVRSENSDGEGPWSPIWTFRVDLTGACAPPPICPTAGLMAPLSNFPANGDIVEDLLPTFSWFYADSCTPEGYRIDVTTYGGYDYGTTISGGTGDPSTLWSPGSPLDPATQYEWRVAGINGATLGPYSTSVPFWTGPICDTAALAAPAQNTPADGAVVGNPFPPMGWSYPNGCIPEMTLLELDTDSTFPGPNLAAGLGGPRIGQIPLAALDDCQQYYWRVRSENSDGAGPYSLTWSFTTDFSGACAGAGAGAGASPLAGAGPMGLATRDLNCRAGDATAFNETGFFAKGSSAEILGKNQAGTWLVVPLQLGGGNCWVSAAYVQLPQDFSLDDLSIIASPPLPPTATPLPESAFPFEVTAASVSVDQSSFRGTCPVRFTFSADITANAAGTVEYRWVRSDGVTGPTQTLNFNSAGTKTVETTWDLTAGIHEGLWEKVEILSPNSLSSNQATFSAYCSNK